jgi:cytoskeletal protein RodZ
VTGPGQLLREARQRQGISLAEAERETHIGRRYLEALEKDDWQACPGEFYARAFLRTYASYLGLSPAEVLQARAATARETDEHQTYPTRNSRRTKKRVRVNVLRLTLTVILLLLLPGLVVLWLMFGR